MTETFEVIPNDLPQAEDSLRLKITRQITQEEFVTIGSLKARKENYQQQIANFEEQIEKIDAQIAAAQTEIEKSK